MNDEKLQTILKEVDIQASDVDAIVEDFCKPYLKNLDGYIANLKNIASEAKYQELSIQELSQTAIFISASLYSLVNALSKSAIRQAVATNLRSERYNSFYQKLERGTIADKKSQSENAVITEALVELIFQRVYNKLKLSYSAGENVYSAIKKLLSVKDSEMKLTIFAKGE